MPLNSIRLHNNASGDTLLISSVQRWFFNVLALNPQDINTFSTRLFTSFSGFDRAFVLGWLNYTHTSSSHPSLYFPDAQGWSRLTPVGQACTVLTLQAVLARFRVVPSLSLPGLRKRRKSQL